MFNDNIYKKINLNNLKNNNNFDTLINTKLNLQIKKRRQIKAKFSHFSKKRIDNTCDHSLYLIQNKKKAIEKLNKFIPKNKSEIDLKKKKLIEFSKIDFNDDYDRFNKSLIILENFHKKEIIEILDDPLYYLKDYPDLIEKLKKYSNDDIFKLLNKNKRNTKLITKDKYKSLCTFNYKKIDKKEIDKRILLKIKSKFMINMNKNKKYENKQKLNLLKNEKISKKLLKKQNLYYLKENKIKDIYKEAIINKIKKLEKFKKYNEITNKNIKKIYSINSNKNFFKFLNKEIKLKLKNNN